MRKLFLLCFVVLASVAVIACEKDTEPGGGGSAGGGIDNTVNSASVPVISKKVLIFDAAVGNGVQVITVPIEYTGAEDFIFDTVKLPTTQFKIEFSDPKCTIADDKVTVKSGGCSATVRFEPVTDAVAANVSDSFVLGHNAVALVGGIVGTDGTMPPKIVKDIFDFGTVLYRAGGDSDYDSDISYYIDLKNDTGATRTVQFSENGDKFSTVGSTEGGCAIERTPNNISVPNGGCKVLVMASFKTPQPNDRLLSAILTIDGTAYLSVANAIEVLPQNEITDENEDQAITATFGNTQVNSKSTIPYGFFIRTTEEGRDEEVAFYDWTLEFKQGFGKNFKINKELTTCTFIPETTSAFTQNIRVKNNCTLIIDFIPSEATGYTFKMIEHWYVKALITDPEMGFVAGEVTDMPTKVTLEGTGTGI